VADLSISITGVDRLVRNLGLATAQAVLTPPTERATTRLKDDLKEYPPPPPGSGYVRTGDLGRAWKSRRPSRTMSGLEGGVFNAVRSRRTGKAYGPFVQKQGEQATVHRGRWQTDADVVAANRRDIEQDFARAIEKALS
jgi:hypothetical protein